MPHLSPPVIAAISDGRERAERMGHLMKGGKTNVESHLYYARCEICTALLVVRWEPPGRGSRPMPTRFLGRAVEHPCGIVPLERETVERYL